MTNLRWFPAVILAVPFLFTPASAVEAQPKGCQNQVCHYGGYCYGCAGAYGFFCSPDFGTCPKTCREGVCGSEGLEDAAECAGRVRQAAALLRLATTPGTLQVPDTSGTYFLVLSQDGDPATLTEATHSVDAAFVRAVVLYVAEVTLADGTIWTADASSVSARASRLLGIRGNQADR
jgi:hypothetical protein